MKYIVYILLFFPVWVTAQTYKYIGIEDGLSNRRIFNIQKDAQGYMWFLTNEGMDRYNGKDIKHYKLNKEAGDAITQAVIAKYQEVTGEGGGQDRRIESSNNGSTRKEAPKVEVARTNEASVPTGRPF